MQELIPDTPHYIAYHDVAAEGSGGVCFSLAYKMQPHVWRNEFPQDIAANVVSFDNPAGSITNSDLELAAEVFAVGIILAEAPQIKHTSIGTLCDNTPTVSWMARWASRSQSLVAGRLLRGLSYMLYQRHAGRLTTVHVAGEENVMADIASRPTKAKALFSSSPTTLSDIQFRSSFDLEFPLPHEQVWRLVSIPEWLKSNVYETLRGKQLALRQWAEPRVNGIGKRGRSTANSTRSAPPGLPLPTHKQCSLHLLSPCGKASTVDDAKSRFSRSKTLSEPLPKNMFWTDTPTPGEPPQPSTHLTCPSRD